MVSPGSSVWGQVRVVGGARLNSTVATEGVSLGAGTSGWSLVCARLDVEASVSSHFTTGTNWLSITGSVVAGKLGLSLSSNAILTIGFLAGSGVVIDIIATALAIATSAAISIRGGSAAIRLALGSVSVPVNVGSLLGSVWASVVASLGSSVLLRGSVGSLRSTILLGSAVRFLGSCVGSLGSSVGFLGSTIRSLAVLSLHGGGEDESSEAGSEFH